MLLHDGLLVTPLPTQSTLAGSTKRRLPTQHSCLTTHPSFSLPATKPPKHNLRSNYPPAHHTCSKPSKLPLQRPLRHLGAAPYPSPLPSQPLMHTSDAPQDAMPKKSHTSCGQRSGTGAHGASLTPYDHAQPTLPLPRPRTEHTQPLWLRDQESRCWQQALAPLG